MSIEDQTRKDAARLAPSAYSRDTIEPGHFVQFYDDDAFLLEEASRFVGGALEAGGGAIVIGTESHVARIEERLTAHGVEVAGARTQGRYVVLDAAETLSAFMEDGWPSATRFDAVVGGAFAGLAERGYTFVRAFGEMVALLFAEGNVKAAIRLEELWNDVRQRYSFSLLCAYPMGGFARVSDRRPFLDICAEHSESYPTESYAMLSTPDQRLRLIAELQQKAAALETEVAQRREVEAELADFLENSVVGLHRVGADGTILWANQAELAMLGYSYEEYIGHHIADFHVDRRVIDKILQKLLAGETLHNYPARLRCKDGSIKEVLIDSNARWNDGEFVHTRCITRDVTELRRAQIERDELLAHEQAANRSKDEFLAMLSHELRTPLTAMLGWMRMLREGKLDEVASARALETIERNSRLQAQLIDDLLDISRIVSGKLKLDSRPVDLVTVIEAALDSVRAAADAKAILIVMSLDPATRTVWGDGGRLQQVVWNLLSNAIKFTQKNGTVTIRLESLNGHARITVADTGSGIPANMLPHIFDRFRQVEEYTTRRRHGGLGLGLAIARELVELQGGTIEAESDGEGRGATFTVTLPVMTEGLLRRAPLGPESERPPERIRLDGIRVLVVDDDSDTRDLVAAALRDSGAEVAGVASASEAVAALSAMTPDVVVADIGMPGEDGYDLISKVRALDGAAGQKPVVALTAYARHEDRERAFAAGFDLHVAKPVEPSALTRAIAKLMRGGRGDSRAGLQGA